MSSTVSNHRSSDMPELHDNITDAKSPLLSMPVEILQTIAATIVSSVDFCNFRLINKRIREVTTHSMGMRIVNMTIYPRYTSIKALIQTIEHEDVVKYVRSITLLAESPRVHEYGYSWAWEDLQMWSHLEYTDKDLMVMQDIDAAHANDIDHNGGFITTGHYRIMLTELLSCLPHLATIKVRKLNPGEHVPGWAGIKLLEKLSFYRDDLDTRYIYYGDWQYDTLHRRTTSYTDEYARRSPSPTPAPRPLSSTTCAPPRLTAAPRRISTSSPRSPRPRRPRSFALLPPMTTLLSKIRDTRP
ncbi:hypothetical protein OPT61_g5194 [Boeremia exigua]|uniref:Uncharacterized protein n=1 Tax=Boeremia exigua TaxID=749465 RepID=A0ACC2IBG0_9PLEO|nr:hypothetical protein OPT61_g5194 [Boeremia exigua]